MTLARSALFFVALAIGTVFGLSIAAFLAHPTRHQAIDFHSSKTGGSHAAAWENPRGSIYELSQHNEIDPNCARVEQIIYETPWHGSVPARGRGVSSVPGNVLQDMWGSNPHRAPHPKQLSKRVVSAQKKESATRLASMALSVMGSAAARPGSIVGAA